MQLPFFALMANVARTPALTDDMLGLRVLAPRRRLRKGGTRAASVDPLTGGVFGLELERAGQRIGFGQAQAKDVADSEPCAGLLAFEGASLLVVTETLGA